MRTKHILKTMLVFLLALICSCSHRYYSDYPGKVTKGYNKAPREWKKPPSRYVSPKKKKLE